LEGRRSPKWLVVIDETGIVTILLAVYDRVEEARGAKAL
jgi:hypothetical protein